MSRAALKKDLLEAQARVSTLLHQLFDDADPDEEASGDAEPVKPEAWSALRATNSRLEKEVAQLRVQLADEQAARSSAQAQSDALGAALAARAGMCAAQLGGGAGGCSTPPAGGGSHPSSPQAAARHEVGSPEPATVRRASDTSMVSEGEEDLRERTASLLQELADFEASPAVGTTTEEEASVAEAPDGDGADGAGGADDSLAPSCTNSPRGSREEAALVAELHNFNSGAAAEQQDRLSELVLGQGVMLRRLEQRFARAQDAWEHGAAMRGGGGGGAAAGGQVDELQARCVEAELRASKLERQRDEAIDRANVAQAMLTAVQNENETLHELAEQAANQLRARNSAPGSGSLLQQMARRPSREPAPASRATPGKVLRSKSVAASILGAQIGQLGGRAAPTDGAATAAQASSADAKAAKHPNAA